MLEYIKSIVSGLIDSILNNWISSNGLLRTWSSYDTQWYGRYIYHQSNAKSRWFELSKFRIHLLFVTATRWPSGIINFYDWCLVEWLIDHAIFTSIKCGWQIVAACAPAAIFGNWIYDSGWKWHRFSPQQLLLMGNQVLFPKIWHMGIRICPKFIPHLPTKLFRDPLMRFFMYHAYYISFMDSLCIHIKGIQFSPFNWQVNCDL